MRLSYANFSTEGISKVALKGYYTLNELMPCTCIWPRARNGLRYFMYGVTTPHSCSIPRFPPCLSPCSMPSVDLFSSYGVRPTPLKLRVAMCMISACSIRHASRRTLSGAQAMCLARWENARVSFDSFLRVMLV